MPFTPYHLGPALLLGLIFGLDIPLVLVGSVIPDFEALYFLSSGPSHRLHGFFHSYLGASIVSLALAFACAKIFPRCDKRKITASLLVGTCSHVFIDSFLYPDMSPFWPIAANPFLAAATSHTVYTSAAFALVAGMVFYAVLKLTWRKKKR